MTEIADSSTPTEERDLETQDDAPESPAGDLWTWFLEQIDAIPYVIVGVVFWLAALLSLAYGLVAFVLQLEAQTIGPDGFVPQHLIAQGLGAQDVISLVSDLVS